MGYSDDILGPEGTGGSGSETDPRSGTASTTDEDPFKAANALDPRTVLAWLGVEVNGDRVATCPGCGADGSDGSVSVVNGGWKCLHAGCAAKGHPRRRGFRTNIDTVCEVTSCQPIEAVRSISEQFGTTAPRPRKARAAKPPSASAPPRPSSADGPDLILSERGGVLSTVHNAAELVRFDHSLRSLAFDAWAQRVVLRGESTPAGTAAPSDPPSPPASASDHEWTDEDTVRVTARFERDYSWRGSHKLVDLAITLVAQERSFNPVLQWLDALTWDGVPRLDAWLVEHAGAADNRYTRTVLRKWLISAVARIRDPGCKVDHVLVLHGKQRQFKSTFLRLLAPAERYYTDQLPPFTQQRDFEEALIGFVFAELAELDHLVRAEPTQTKAAITRQRGHCRLAYAHRSTILPRTCVFAGTSNEEEFLVDSTGDRRWWPVRVGRIDLVALVRDRLQLWAEASHRHAQGEPWYLSEDEEAEASREQASRYRTDPWEPMVLEAVTGFEWTTVNTLLTGTLKIEPGRVSQADANRVARILRRLGGQRRRHTVGGGSAHWAYHCSGGRWMSPEDREREAGSHDPDHDTGNRITPGSQTEPQDPHDPLDPLSNRKSSDRGTIDRGVAEKVIGGTGSHWITGSCAHVGDGDGTDRAADQGRSEGADQASFADWVDGVLGPVPGGDDGGDP